MALTVAIRTEDKNEWERRVPLIPSDVAALRARGIDAFVEPSPIRAYSDREYEEQSVPLDANLDRAGFVAGVKEIPTSKLQPGKVYLYFAHVVKAQPYNMGMLRRLLDLGCSLVDYEKIADDKGRRLVFFGKFAGNAGMIDTLRCLGTRLALDGQPSPLADVKSAYQYRDLPDAKAHIRALGEAIRNDGTLGAKRPIVFGVTGYGNVSQGAQEVLDVLPITEVTVEDLPRIAASPAPTPFVKVVFREEHLARRIDASAPFALDEYYANPERYSGRFEEHLPHLDVLVNCIYWEPRYPRLVTRVWVKDNYGPDRRPRLSVIGDISCDIEGSVEVTLEATSPDRPAFVYDPADGQIHYGCVGNGPVIMSVDNLPCELPREASQHFSSVLRDMVYDMAMADWSKPFDELGLPSHLARAVIVHKGELTPTYRYLEPHLPA